MGNISGDKRTANIIRRICPPVYQFSAAENRILIGALEICLAPNQSFTEEQAMICDAYILTLSQFKMARDQSRICFKQ